MTAPRFRQDADGRVAIIWPGMPTCLVYGPDGHVWHLDVARVHGEGWSEAVLVALPEPDSVDLVCGCGIPPDGAPTAEGCCRECMEPVVAFFPGGVSVDLQHGALYDGTGRTFEADAAELQAARLLSAAAFWRATSPAEPACTCGIDLPGAAPEHMPDCAVMTSPAEPTEGGGGHAGRLTFGSEQGRFHIGEHGGVGEAGNSSRASADAPSTPAEPTEGACTRPDDPACSCRVGPPYDPPHGYRPGDHVHIPESAEPTEPAGER